ncbi:LbetaH domain-containing protein [Polaribacter marinaquae]|uniref:Serine acetyltransferase n=1 Tax=Polaribacter marinaquae TaxID=1642819 RepID=A0ABZ2TU27_9FLAO
MTDIINFISFLQKKVFKPVLIPSYIVNRALESTILDVRYHFPETNENEIIFRIINNKNELAIFLYRLGSELHNVNLDNLTPQVHWLLKELCSCEIYFNNKIDEGFYIVHGQSTIIGSRNKIGRGFKIHQGCTIGHKINGKGTGNIIGNNVVMYCNSSIIGENKIADNVVIGAHTLVNKDVEKDKIVITNTKTIYRE